MEREELKQKIYLLKEELYKLLIVNSLNSDVSLKKSHELDMLIINWTYRDC